MTDIEIAQKAKMEKISVIAEKIGLCENDYEPYGKYKAKVSLDVLERNSDKKDGNSSVKLFLSVQPNFFKSENILSL